MVDYSNMKVQTVIGGGDAQDDDGFLLSQTQHVLGDDELFYASMMLNRSTRVLKHDGSKVQDIDGMDNNMELPGGMCFHGDDKIAVCDVNGNKVKIFNRAGLSVDSTLEPDDALTSPNAIASDGAGGLYIAEVGDNKQLRFVGSDLTNKFTVKSAGGKDFTGVNYVAFDKSNGRVVCSDAEGNLVAVFTKDGDHVLNIDSDGSDPGQLSSPQGVAVDDKGNILVCDFANNRVQAFDSDGKFISLVGGEDTFQFPMGICTLSNGRIAVVDGNMFMGWSRIQILA